MLGWLFQMDFEEFIRATPPRQPLPINLYDSEVKDQGPSESWPVASGCLEFFDESELSRLQKDRLVSNVWLLPMKINQPLYDALQLVRDLGCPSGMILRVVQVTYGLSHKLKFEFLEGAIRELVGNGVIISKLDVVIVVPNGHQSQFSSAPVDSICPRMFTIPPFVSRQAHMNDVLRHKLVRVLGMVPQGNAVY